MKSLTPFSIEAILTRQTRGEGRRETAGILPGSGQGMRASEEERVPVLGAPAMATVPALSAAISPSSVSASPIDMTLRRDSSTPRVQSNPHVDTHSRSPDNDRLNEDSMPDVFSECSYSGNSDDDDDDAEDEEDDVDCTEYAADVEEGTFLDLTCREILTPGNGGRNKQNPRSISTPLNMSSITNNGTCIPYIEYFFLIEVSAVIA